MDGALRTERVVLLGFVTLLGATGTLYTALTALVISAAAALIVYAAHAALRRIAPKSAAAAWTLLIAAGFAVSWLLSAVASYVVVIPEGAMLFLRLAGVSPIVFYAAARQVSLREALLGWMHFAALLPATGAIRELFGRGTLGGYLTPAGFTVPAGFFASPIGAFLLLAGVVLGARIAVRVAGNSAGEPANRGGER